MAGSVRWYPGRLNEAIQQAFDQSLKIAAFDANAHSPSQEAGAEVVSIGDTEAQLAVTGRLGGIMERGAGPHEETGTKGFLYINGSYVSGTIHHPGSAAKPYVGPAASRWASGGFHGTARGILAARGFR